MPHQQLGYRRLDHASVGSGRASLDGKLVVAALVLFVAALSVGFVVYYRYFMALGL